IGEQDERGLARGIERPESGDERGRLTVRVPLVHDDPRSFGQVQRVAHPNRVVAEDDDDLADARRRRRVDRIQDQRLAAEDLELLGAAEPRAVAGRQDERGDHASRLPNRRRKKPLMEAQKAASPRRIPPMGLAREDASMRAATAAAMSADSVARTSAAPMLWRRQSANCCVSLRLTSGNSPRLSCATVPVRWMSARIFTLVTPSPCSSQLVTEALAAPFPFCSIPLAASTIRLAWSSRSCIVTVPANASETGPSFMLTLPFQVWSSMTSVSSAPGMHGATRSTSRRYVQTWSMGAGTSNSFSISICSSAALRLGREYRERAGFRVTGRRAARGSAHGGP